MIKKTYEIIFRYSPSGEWLRRKVTAYNEEQVKCYIMFEDEVTKNQIEFKSINLSEIVARN